jgi:hypothetical protein
MEGLMLHAGANRIGRQDLLALPTPAGTDTHTVVPHSKLVESTLEALAFRQITVVKDEYGISPDGMKMFGVLTLSVTYGDGGDAINLALGLRNSHDKSFALGMVAGFRVFCCDNLAFRGEFFALSRKHSKRLMDEFVDVVAIGVDRAQRHFAPMRDKINTWKGYELPDVQAKALIYDAFVGAVEIPKHTMKEVHRQYFEPQFEVFQPRNLWSLQNAFTGAAKALDPLPQARALSSIGEYFEALG